MAEAPPKPESEADLLRILADRLAARLPETWQSSLTLEPTYGRRRADAILRLVAPDGTSARMLVEAKTILNARDVPAVLSQLWAIRQEMPDEEISEGPPFVVARYLSPNTRELLDDVGASYADATGNLRLFLDRPAVYLEGIGANADPWRGPDRPIGTLKGRPAAKVVRALVDYKPPVKIRELSLRSGASLGSTSRVVDFLDKEALVSREDSGAVIDVLWDKLLYRWTEDYSFQGSNSVRAAFEPRGISRFVERLRDQAPTVPYAVSGSLSTQRYARIAEPRLALLFADEPERFAEETELRIADAATNVLIARPFDPVVFDRATTEDGVVYAALSQTVGDLLTSPGRGPVEGEVLIEWMKENVDVWRH